MKKLSEKELKLLNNKYKSDCISSAAAFPMSCKDKTTAEVAALLKDKLLECSVGNSQKVYNKLKELTTNLEKAESANKTGNYNLAKFYFEDAIDIAAEINAESYKENAVVKTKDDKKVAKALKKEEKILAKLKKEKPQEVAKLEQLNDKFEELSTKRDELLSRINRLKTKVNLGNRIVDEQFNTYASDYRKVDTLLNNVTGQKRKLEEALNIKDLVEETDTYDVSDVMSDDEIQRLIQRANEQNTKNADTADMLNSMKNVYNNQTSFAGAQGYQSAYQGVDTSFLDQAGVQNNQEVKTDIFNETAQSNEIDDQIKTLKKKCNEMISKIDKAEVKLVDLDDELRNLLEDRKQASASERIGLDAKIDRVLTERENYQMQMKAYRQQHQKLSNYENMLSQLKNTQEIDKINRELDALTGTMEDLDNITEQIYSSRERANASHKEVLEHKEMLNGALSEFDDSEKQNAEREKFSMDEEIDDNKYAEVEKELMMRQM